MPRKLFTHKPTKPRRTSATTSLKSRIAELEAALELSKASSGEHAQPSSSTLPTKPENNAVYRSLSEHLPGVVYRLYLQEKKRMEFFNDMLFQITGYGVHELKEGKIVSIDSLILQEDLQRVETTVSKALSESSPYRIDYRITHKDGSIRHLEERGRPIKGEDGKPLWIDGVIFDITEKKTLEQIWKRYEFIVNTSREFMTLIRKGFVYEAVNEAYCQAHKMSREQIVGHTVTEVWGSEAFGRIKPHLEKCFEGKEVHYRFSFSFAALGMRYFDVTYYPYYGLEGQVTHVVVVSRDMTKNHLMEVERDRLAIVINQSAEGVLITDSEGAIEYANPAFEKMSGFKAAELVGKTTRVVKSNKHPASFYQQLWQTIKAGEVWRGHFINSRSDGSLYEVNSIISPVRDEGGQIIHYVAGMNDVTRELALEKQIQQSKKLEAIGTLAGGIAHDFNNILCAILGFADLTRVEIAEDHPVQDNLGEIIQASRRAQELIAQILTFSRQVEPNRNTIALHEVVMEGLNLLRSTIPKSVLIKTSFTTENTFILGNSTRIHQIVINLITNAVQALPEQHGIIKVSIESMVISPEKNCDSADLAPGRYLVLSVKDSGVGMNQHVLSRIFEPYFTTKPQGKGNGLGLAMVHGIMKEHDGSISVVSEPGVGTTFRLVFPASESQPSKVAQPKRTSSICRGRILLVDDEPALVNFGQKALQHLGFQVEGIGDPRAALELFTSNPKRFDAIISDIAMPDLTGPDLVEKIRKIDSDIPVFLASGFDSGQISTDAAQRLKISGLLKKPYSISDLNETLSSVLALSAKKNENT